ncbi:MAG TPA: secretion protein [Anaeromyxobacteraceae bacterium]|nr:secretion protein [Anaeromyxobacteraceae bacterium]
MRARLATIVVAFAAGCGDERILHRLDEPQANQVLVALSEAGVAARLEREAGDEGGFAVAVRPADAGAARDVLAARDLPRQRAPGLGELFGSPGLVPTPLEEHARYLHALSGELARSLESLDGVVGARVHLALPAPDPLRPDARRSPRASVLLKCRPGRGSHLEAQADGLRRMVAGAADGLDPASVSVMVAEAPALAPRPGPGRGARAWLAASGIAVAAALGVGAVVLGRRKGAPR